MKVSVRSRWDRARELAATGLHMLAARVDPSRPYVVPMPVGSGWSVMVSGERIASIRFGAAGVSSVRQRVSRVL